MSLGFYAPGTYRIQIGGYLERSWSGRLGGMDITWSDAEGENPVTTLCGRLLDQAALLGVLNALYGLHLPLLSVERLTTEPAGEQPVADQ
jgi:hypothetical protein